MVLKLVSEGFPDVSLECYGCDIERPAPYYDVGEVTARVRYVPASIRETHGIRKVIFNDPATIVLWNDGTKTVVKCMEGDTYSQEKGLAMCICKKALGNQYHKVFKEWIKNQQERSNNDSNKIHTG